MPFSGEVGFASHSGIPLLDSGLTLTNSVHSESTPFSLEALYLGLSFRRIWRLPIPWAAACGVVTVLVLFNVLLIYRAIFFFIGFALKYPPPLPPLFVLRVPLLHGR